MAPRKDNTARDSEERIENDVSSSAAGDAVHHGDPSTVSTNVDDEPDPWAISAEGYTPLNDIGGDDGGAVFMAYSPEEETEEGGNGGGAFYAEPSTFLAASSGDDHDDQEWLDGENQDSATVQDFQSLAEQALRALDDEYQATVGPMSRDNAAVTSALDIDSDDMAAKVHLNPEGFGPQAISTSVPPTQPFELPKKEQPIIDTDAVRRAVDSISLKAPKLTSNMESWQQERKQKREQQDDHSSTASSQATAPREHPLIPQAPLSAFRKRTTKAVFATANLSRSCTLAECIHRLSCLSDPKERLVIHIVGADHVECQSPEVLQSIFGPFVRWIGSLETSPGCIDFHLIGPNVPADATALSPVSLMPKTKLKATSRLVEATACCHASVYDEWIAQQQSADQFCVPDVAVAFNAGVWGYKEWPTTLSRLVQLNLQIPLVLTAYTVQEAEDDAEVVEEIVGAAEQSTKRIWGVESNPFASRKERPTATAVNGRDYRENAAWQAWRL